MPLHPDKFNVLHLFFLSRVCLARRKADVDNLEGEGIRVLSWRERRHQEVACGVSTGSRRSRVRDIVSLVVALIDNDRHPSSSVHTRRVKHKAAG